MICLQLNEGINLGASEAAGILMSRMLHIHSMSIWSQGERCHDPWHACWYIKSTPHPDLPAWCCWSERIMSAEFPQNSSIGCGKWSRGNSTDTPQAIYHVWWKRVVKWTGAGGRAFQMLADSAKQIYVACMHACLPAHACSGNPACEILRDFLPHHIWWIWWHARGGLSPEFVTQKNCSRKLADVTRSRKTTWIHWTPKNLPDQPVAQHTRALKFIILVPVSRISVHATTGEAVHLPIS